MHVGRARVDGLFGGLRLADDVLQEKADAVAPREDVEEGASVRGEQGREGTPW